MFYLPQLRSFKAAVLSVVAGVALLWIAFSMMGGSILSMLLLLVAAWLCWLAAKRHVRFGKARAHGLRTENRAVSALKSELAVVGWEMGRTGGLIPGIGNIDAVINMPGHSVVVEIKAYASVVRDGRAVRARTGKSSEDAVRQVSAQLKHSRKSAGVIWCPSGRNYADVTREGILVVNGSARFLVMKLGQMLV